MSTEIVPSATTAPLAPEARGFVQLQTFSQAREFAEYIAKSDFIPKDYIGKPGNIIVAMQMGLELGLPPLQALQSIAVVNGRPALWGDGLRALILSAPDLENLEETNDGTVATCIIQRTGRGRVVRSFSMAQAKHAGLTAKNNTPWQTYPDRMLSWRAFGWAARDAYADRLRGIGLAEELNDIEHEPSPAAPREPERIKDVTPQGETLPAATTTSATAADTTRAGATPEAAATRSGTTTTDTATEVLRQVEVLDTFYIAPNGSKKARWEVKTAKHGTLVTLDEQTAKSLQTCVGTDTRLALTVTHTKVTAGIAKVITQIDSEDGAA